MQHDEMIFPNRMGIIRRTALFSLTCMFVGLIFMGT